LPQKLEGKRGEVYNIASGKSITINELAKLMTSIAGKNHKIKHIEPRQGEIRYSKTSIEKAKKEIGFKPRMKPGNILQTNIV